MTGKYYKVECGNTDIYISGCEPVYLIIDGYPPTFPKIGLHKLLNRVRKIDNKHDLMCYLCKLPYDLDPHLPKYYK